MFAGYPGYGDPYSKQHRSGGDMYDPRQYYYHYYNPQQHYYYYNDPKYREYYKYMQKHYQQVGNHV